MVDRRVQIVLTAKTEEAAKQLRKILGDLDAIAKQGASASQSLKQINQAVVEQSKARIAATKEQAAVEKLATQQALDAIRIRAEEETARHRKALEASQRQAVIDKGVNDKALALEKKRQAITATSSKSAIAAASERAAIAKAESESSKAAIAATKERAAISRAASDEELENIKVRVAQEQAAAKAVLSASQQKLADIKNQTAQEQQLTAQIRRQAAERREAQSQAKEAAQAQAEATQQKAEAQRGSRDTLLAEIRILQQQLTLQQQQAQGARTATEQRNASASASRTEVQIQQKQIELQKQYILQLRAEVEAGGDSTELAVQELALKREEVKLQQQLAGNQAGGGGVRKATQSVAELASKYFLVKEAINGIRAIAGKVYSTLIAQNEELGSVVLTTATAIASTQDVLRNGERIADPAEQIRALFPQIEAAVDRIREKTFDLVGVTSSQVIPLLQIVSQNGQNLEASIEQSADLSVKFAAALGTFNVPLFQARQEIASILQGTIDNNSVLAKSLGINNEIVQQQIQQGKLLDFLNEKLETAAVGNLEAAKGIGAVTSNIVEVVEEVTRLAGKPLLEPVATALAEIYKGLQDNRPQLQAIATTIGDGLATAFQIGREFIANIMPPLVELGQQMLVGVRSVVESLGVDRDSVVATLRVILMQVSDLLTGWLKVQQVITAIAGVVAEMLLPAVERTARVVTAQLTLGLSEVYRWYTRINIEGEKQEAIAGRQAEAAEQLRGAIAKLNDGVLLSTREFEALQEQVAEAFDPVEAARLLDVLAQAQQQARATGATLEEVSPAQGVAQQVQRLQQQLKQGSDDLQREIAVFEADLLNQQVQGILTAEEVQGRLLERRRAAISNNVEQIAGDLAEIEEGLISDAEFESLQSAAEASKQAVEDAEQQVRDAQGRLNRQLNRRRVLIDVGADTSELDAAIANADIEIQLLKEESVAAQEAARVAANQRNLAEADRIAFEESTKTLNAELAALEKQRAELELKIRQDALQDQQQLLDAQLTVEKRVFAERRELLQEEQRELGRLNELRRIQLDLSEAQATENERQRLNVLEDATRERQSELQAYQELLEGLEEGERVFVAQEQRRLSAEDITKRITELEREQARSAAERVAIESAAENRRLEAKRSELAVEAQIEASKIRQQQLDLEQQTLNNQIEQQKLALQIEGEQDIEKREQLKAQLLLLQQQGGAIANQSDELSNQAVLTAERLATQEQQLDIQINANTDEAERQIRQLIEDSFGS